MSKSNEGFECPYCKVSYTREKTLAVHMCEKKRRALQKDEKRVQLGYLTFNRFYKLCQRFDGVKTYDRFHPEYTKANGKINETRYCRDKLWNNDDILVDYNMSIRLEKQYDIYNDDGSKLVLDPPKTLFFRTPNDEDTYGDDADKKFRLDYQGDHLGGIPGEVIDFDTGESLGEYVKEWKR